MTDLRTRLGRITVAKVDEALGRVVNRFGAGHVDTSHHFFSSWTGKPGCLVGQILAELGVRTEDTDNLHVAATSGLLTQINADIEPAAAMYLYALQAHNDSDRPWGGAAEAAWRDVLAIHARKKELCGCSGCCGYSGYWARLCQAFLGEPAPRRVQPTPLRVDVSLTPAEVDARWAQLTYGALASIETVEPYKLLASVT